MSARREGYCVMTRKNLALALPRLTVKVNEPVPSVLVCSGVHWPSGLMTFVELTSAIDLCGRQRHLPATSG